MQKTYNPKEFEDRIYKTWLEKKYFHATIDADKTPFTMMMPPPNITGQLHLGHALDNAIIDIIIRFKRMQGHSALYLPGVDHASIATEVKIVEQIKREEGITKEELGREEFLKRAWQWKEKYGNVICKQLEKIGVSCDWDRLAFTMDENCSKAVRYAFVKLYNKGLIYRGDRIANWCPSCHTAISDAEVEYTEHAAHLWHIRYAIQGSEESLIVATTRPETLLGDTAIAVNGADKRYKHLIGKKAIVPLIGREIAIIADDYVDMEFGSGAVKITPAHDPNDFEVGERHALEQIVVMHSDGTMNENAGKYAGLDRMVAREKILIDLEKIGALVKTNEHTHNVGHCYRCNTVIEPMLSRQWFVKMESLAQPAIDAVTRNKIHFIPERFSKNYFNWLEGIKDWCISRQLWWGHRIPVWYCDACHKESVSEKDLEHCMHCGSKDIWQDNDVLDTWFSSALWPFATLGFANQAEDYNYFYPTDVLSCGYDILFFWVIRMVFSGIEYTGKLPFRDIVMHGIVRDAQGRKMSKSLGNGINPLEVIEEYGADSLRLSLVTGVAAGNDMRFSENKIEASRNFLNKVWNASRFVLINADGIEILTIDKMKLTSADKWILAKLEQTIKEVTLHLNKFELGIAATTIHDFIWNDFCDWYIELAKAALYSDDINKKQQTLSVTYYVLEQALKLLHPFAPFITEEIYQNLSNVQGSIMIADFPRYQSKLAYKKEAKSFEAIMDVIKAVRIVKTNVNCPPSKKVNLYVKTESKRLLTANVAAIERLAGIEKLYFIDDAVTIGEKVVSHMTAECAIYIPLGELVDMQKEKKRLQDELKIVMQEIKRADGKLQNVGFLEKAPKELIQQERDKLEKYLKMKDSIEKQLQEL